MRALITICVFLMGSTAIAGGTHCTLKEGLTADNYFTFNEYFVQGSFSNEHTVTVVTNTGDLVTMECADSRKSVSTLGRVIDCGDNRLSFAIDNKVPNDKSNYNCESRLFKDAEDVLNKAFLFQ